MKICGKGGGGWSLLKEWTSRRLSRDLVIKLRWQMPIFLFRLLTPFLSISVCWFGFGLW